jgi:hypothetical protein
LPATLEEATDEDRTKLGLAKDGMALRVIHVGMYGKSAAGKNAGFRDGDVSVALDGDSKRTTEGELIGTLLQTRMPGEKIKTVVLRGKDRVELNLPMQ